jgi:hypothetical protein
MAIRPYKTGIFLNNGYHFFHIKHSLILLLILFSAGIPLYSQKEQFISADNTNIQYWGRIEMKDPKAPVFAWPGTSVLISFKGKQISIRMRNERDDINYYNVIIDNNEAKPLILESTKSQTNFDITGLPDRDHSL